MPDENEQLHYAGHPDILAVASVMLQYEQAECPLTHRFTNGMYIRQIFMPAGTLVASQIHKTQHPFTILQGLVTVNLNGEVIMLEAGHLGITEPGTQRLIFVHEDTLWATFHPNPTNETDIAKLEASLIEPCNLISL